MPKCNIQYYPKVKKVKIDAESSAFYPQYLKYLFEYLKISPKATIIFKDKTIVGGIDVWLKENKI